MIGFDVVLQARHHIFTANVVSTMAICGFVVLIPAAAMSVPLATFFIFADPALIGLAFVGAIVLMEKTMRVHMALGVTPSPAWIYVASKVLILTVAGTLSGLAVAWVAYRGSFDWAVMTFGLGLSNMLAVLIGFILVARARSMNDLLVRLLYANTILFLPLGDHFGLVPEPFQYLTWPIPSTQMLWLIGAAGEPANIADWQFWGAIAYLLVCIFLASAWALKAYRVALSEGR